MLERLPPPVRTLLLLALFALGFALLANVFVTRFLTVDPAALEAIRAGAPAPVDEASPDETVPDAVEAAPRDRVVARTLAWFMDPIVGRNLFDSTNALAGAKPDAESSAEPGTEVTKSELQVTLISTSPAEPERYSTAMVIVESEPAEVYGLGDKFLDAEIVAICGAWLDDQGQHRPARIEVRRADGSVEYIEVGGEAPRSKAKAKSKDDEEPKTAATTRSGRRDWDKDITKNSETSYTVANEGLQWALGNLDKLSREARFVPNFQDGEANGVKVFSIRRNSLPRALGLKNNDVLTAINGNSLSDLSKAMELYGKLLNERSFSLEVLRNGEKVTMEYQVQ